MLYKPMALELDRVARRYGTRPSALVALHDTAPALDFDLAIAARARQEQQDRMDEATSAIADEDGLSTFFVRVLMLLNEMV